MTSIIRVGQSKFVTVQIDEDSNERIMTCIQTLSGLESQPAVQEMYLEDTKTAFTKMLGAQEVRFSLISTYLSPADAFSIKETRSWKERCRDYQSRGHSSGWFTVFPSVLEEDCRWCYRCELNPLSCRCWLMNPLVSYAVWWRRWSSYRIRGSPGRLYVQSQPHLAVDRSAMILQCNCLPPLTHCNIGFSDPIYAEAYVKMHGFDILLGMWLLSESQSQFNNMIQMSFWSIRLRTPCRIYAWTLPHLAIWRSSSGLLFILLLLMASRVSKLR